MVELEECRKILLDNEEVYTDDELIMIREHLLKMAKVVIEKKVNEEKKDVK